MLSKLLDFLKALGRGIADLLYVFFAPGNPDDLSTDEEDAITMAQDVFALQKLMGQADLQVSRRYLAQTDQDIQTTRMRGSLVDKNL